MRILRRLGLAALALAYLQIVFGAIVRITGSGLGCGEHWPDCYGSFTPANHGLGLLIEISHRYGAAVLSVAVLALVLAAFFNRDERGVGGRGGVLRPSLMAVALVILAALLGAATVKLALNPVVIVSHLAIAMSLLAVLSVTVLRAGGLGAQSALEGASGRTWRAARLAVVFAALTLVLGALTANVPDAAVSCGGFPWCRAVNSGGTPLALNIAHRVIAFLLFGHLFGVAAGVSKRKEPRALVHAAWIAFGLAVVQVLIAAAMVEMYFPMSLRSLHQAAGTLLWLSICVLAGLARIASRAELKTDDALPAAAA